MIFDYNLFVLIFSKALNSLLDTRQSRVIFHRLKWRRVTSQTSLQALKTELKDFYPKWQWLQSVWCQESKITTILNMNEDFEMAVTVVEIL